MYFYPIKYTRTPYNNATPGSPRNPDVNALSALIPTHASSPFSCRYSVYQKKWRSIPKTSRSIKFSASSAPFFISPPARTSLIYIYSCLSRRYSYHTMETTADIFFSLPGYSLSGCIFLPVFLYTVTNSPAKAVRIPGISNVTTLSVREEHT